MQCSNDREGGRPFHASVWSFLSFVLTQYHRHTHTTRHHIDIAAPPPVPASPRQTPLAVKEKLDTLGPLPSLLCFCLGWKGRPPMFRSVLRAASGVGRGVRGRGRRVRACMHGPRFHASCSSNISRVWISPTVEKHGKRPLLPWQIDSLPCAVCVLVEGFVGERDWGKEVSNEHTGT